MTLRWPWRRARPAEAALLPPAVQREIAQALESCTAHTRLGREEGLAIARHMRLRAVRPGTVLVREAEADAAFMLLVLEGEARVEQGTGGPDGAMVLTVAGRGALLGEQGLVDAGVRTATITAVTEMRLAVLDQPGFRRLVDAAPRAACALLGAMLHAASGRLREANRRLRVLSGMNRALQEEVEVEATEPVPLEPAPQHRAAALGGIGVPIV